jgi:hypothetical protein
VPHYTLAIGAVAVDLKKRPEVEKETSSKVFFKVNILRNL